MQVVVTGANRGIGAGLAEAYRAEGHNVTGTARDQSCDVVLDVTQPDQFGGLKAALSDKPVDLLICNAGVYLDKGEALEDGYPAQQWADSFAVNVTGVFLTVQSLLPNLRAAEAGKVAIISSQMGTKARAKGSSFIYRASKAAALNLGFNLSTALQEDGIAVGIYHPGWVQTDMGGGAADIDIGQSVSGLVSRFAELDLASTGCFKTWDGRDHPL